jgi:hypothetical protein
VHIHWSMTRFKKKIGFLGSMFSNIDKRTQKAGIFIFFFFLSMFENIKPNFLFQSFHLTLEKAVQEKKVIKNVNRMRLGANYFQNLRI